jgi:arginine-tRNA-protein transferase
MLEIASFTSEPHTCAYLHDRPARNSYRLVFHLDPAEYSAALAKGWRRFGRVLFRPRCEPCRECVPIRVPVAEFRPSRTQRRVLRRNRDVVVEVGEPWCDEERLELYRRHHADRERRCGWAATRVDEDEYSESFVINCVSTLEFRYRLRGRLVAVAYVGEAEDALNSVYGFYDPAAARRRLGTFDVLVEIQEALQREKRYLYLGFLVTGCRSMAYKASYRPYELLRGGRWARADAIGAGA